MVPTLPRLFTETVAICQGQRVPNFGDPLLRGPFARASPAICPWQIFPRDTLDINRQKRTPIVL